MCDFFNGFFFGRLTPFETKMPASPERLAAVRTLDEAETSLRSRLNGDCAEALERLLAAQQNVESLSEQEHFIQGFKLGVRLMVAVLSDASGGETPGSKEKAV